MIVPRDEGGNDFHQVHKASLVEMSCRIWKDEGFYEDFQAALKRGEDQRQVKDR